MKRKLLSLLLFVPAIMFAQSQRMVLVEHFSNASCGPCASQNPALNTLLDNNTTKAIALKYQASWPGTDPMNAQNAPDAAARVSYYGVTGVPNSRVNGSAYAGSPGGVTQTLINNQYAIPSSFDLTVNHTFTPNYSSVDITYTITASQAFTTTNPLVLHLALTEKVIEFATAPGSNGEKVFKHVMRTMAPTNAGTTLAGTWTAGQTVTNTITVPVPTYIYDLGQVEIVAFIQENGVRDVHQAAKSAAQPLALDGAVTAISGLPAVQCTPTINPTVTITNTGATTLTSADVEVRIGAGTPTIVPWTGSLATGATATVNVPAMTGTAGGQTITATLTNINGSPDLNTGNNVKTGSFSLFLNASPAPIADGFEATTFPPANWAIYSPAATNGWARRTGIVGPNGTTAAARAFFYNTPNGSVDELFMPQADLTGNATDTVTLTFHVAHAQYAASTSDKIEVKVSTDCGTTWNTMYNKSGATLATAPISTTNWVPTAADWRLETVDLSTYANSAALLVKFTATSNYGNNAFIDNVNLTRNGAVVSALDDDDNAYVQGQNYPNPASTFTTLDVKDVPAGVRLYVSDMTGRTVMSREVAEGTSALVIETANLNNGMYVYQLRQGLEVLATGKMTVQH